MKETLKIYKWEGQGHYLGATVIVTANCLSDAITMIKKELIEHGLPNSYDYYRFIEEIPINQPKLIYVDNGGY